MALTKVTGQVIKNTTDVTVGVLTVTNTLAVGGTVSIGGTLTYEDVTNVDAVGLITARNGIVVGSGITLSKDGDVFFTGIATGNGSGLTNINAANLTLTNQASDTECFPVFAQAPTSNQLPHTNTSLKFNASTGALTATSFVGSGANLTGIDTDLVSDTSPQLGGNLDVNTKNIVFGDSAGATDDRLTFGASTDLSIYHDGSHSRIDETGTGNLMIQSDNAVFIKKGTSENIAIFNADGAVELYHDNTKVFETDANGIHVTTNVHMNDNGVLELGTGSDFQLSHDGTNSTILNQTGNLRIRNAGQFQVTKSSTENMLIAAPDGAVELYHDNSKKLATTTTGIDINTGDADLGSSVKLYGHDALKRGRWGYSTAYKGLIVGRTDASNDATIFMGVDASGNTSGAFGGNGSEIVFRNDLSFYHPNDANNNWHSFMRTGRFGDTGAVCFPNGLGFGSDTATANVLDDYEEGTYTPADASGAGLSLTNNTTARYTKIGRMMYIQFDITWPTTSNAATAGFTMPTGLGMSISYGTGVIGWTDNGKPLFIHVGGQIYIMDNNNSVGNSSQHTLNSEISGKRLIGSVWYIS